MLTNEDSVKVLLVITRDLAKRLEPILQTFGCDIVIAGSEHNLATLADACDIAVLEIQADNIETNELYLALQEEAQGCGIIIISDEQIPVSEWPKDCHITAAPTSDTGMLGALIFQAGLHNRTRRALRASRLLADLGSATSRIVHDINNILAVIIGNAQLACSEMSPGMPGHEEVIEIFNEARRGREFISTMRHFSPKKKSYQTRIAVSDILEDFIAFFGETLPENIRFDAPAACDAEITVDKTQIKTALETICRNAVEAMPGGGCLGISCMHRRGRCIISISDTGAGMPMDICLNAANPFFTTKRNHFGLGLSVARFIIEFHEGRLTITSQPGEGTTVNISLPIAENV